MNWCIIITGVDISPRSAIKIDLFKAFDSLNWDFIINMLIAAGFPSIFIDWVKGCITSPGFRCRLMDPLQVSLRGKGAFVKEILCLNISSS